MNAGTDPRTVSDLPLPSPPWADGPGGCIVGLASAIAGRFRADRSIAGASVAGVSVAGAHGPASGAGGLADAKIAAAIAQARHVVLVLFDGLGNRQLDTLIPGGAIVHSRRTALRSVFPSSTAPAITSFSTAVFPAEHANPGWFCWSEASASVVRTLPMDVRAAPDQLVTADGLWDWRAASLRFGVPVVAVQPHFIADSTFSRHAWAGAKRVGYRGRDELIEAVDAAVRANPDGAFVWAYMPHFDSTSHERGWQSDAAAEVAGRFDQLFERLAQRLAASGALLLATADHGFVDVPPAQQLRLDDYPEIAALLERPLTGEPRVVYCQVRPGCHEAFEALARETLGHAFEVVPSGALVRAGWFGPGAVSPRLAGRIGTHTLIGRDRHTLVDRLSGEPEPAFIGMHGGIHPDELSVPLAAACRGAPL